jgi:hypothetical protein
VPKRLIHFARDTVAGALILLFGPAPLVYLLDSPVSGEAECQMACCRGKHHARHCTGHDDAADSASVQLRAAVDCGSNCGGAVLAPSSSIQKGLLAQRTSVALPDTPNVRVKAAPAPRILAASDPLLYQRPPPANL